MPEPRRVAVLTSVYESGRPFVEEFVGSLTRALPQAGAGLIAVVDDFKDPEAAFRPLLETGVDVRFRLAPGDSDVAAIRRAMLRAAYENGVDVAIFVDMDDLLLETSIEAHLSALETADFSYGDVELIDDRSRSLGRRFFDGARVPDKVRSVDAVRERNFLGFTNTAANRRCLKPGATAVPAGTIAVDWWFFTSLLLAGQKGARTKHPVTAYRVHGDNVHSGRGHGQVAARIGMMAEHYRNFKGEPAFDKLRRQAETLGDWVAANPRETERMVAGLGENPGVWFDDIRLLRQRVETAGVCLGG